MDIRDRDYAFHTVERPVIGMHTTGNGDEYGSQHDALDSTFHDCPLFPGDATIRRLLDTAGDASMTKTHIWSHRAFLVTLSLYLLALGAGLLFLFDTIPMLFEGSSLAARSGEITRTIVEGLFNSQGRPPSLKYELITGRLAILGVLLVFFAGAVLLMVPITWVYMYTHPFSYRRTFITALIILPICATATVWLIHDSLALAFGLAALVAAVRFRIRLEDPLDGVYVFSSISVGLSSGTGQLLVGYVMACFFCFGATIMWISRYGKRPKAETITTTADEGAVVAGDAVQLPRQRP
ncbi:MAG: hypothetical protein IPF57_19855 [Gammaproteobacteria bacterium]|nr:hypothetical protein [Gammaproteobacteria bacterium]MBP7910713.1 hypothetical protein [Pseudomonadales bacterium]